MITAMTDRMKWVTTGAMEIMPNTRVQGVAHMDGFSQIGVIQKG
jgi:hypothetical protein